MKIGIVGVCDQRHMSLISLYTELFDRVGYSYELICVDRYRDGAMNYNECPTHIYQFSPESEISKKRKLLDFIKFSKYARKRIDEAKFDYLVIWNENTIVLLADYLLKKYPGRYCVNIRDHDFKVPLFLNPIRKKVIRESAFTTVPSPGIIGCLPEDYEHTLVISKNEKLIRKCECRTSFRDPEQAIRISFIGKVRLMSQDRYLMEAFGNDSRFILQFFGAGATQYKDIVSSLGLNNVELGGAFKTEDTPKYINKTDIMAIHYGVGPGGVGDVAFPIKFSYGPSLYFPNIVTKGTLMADIGVPKGFCFAIDESLDPEDFANELYKWYRKSNFDTFRENCNKYREWVDQINSQFEAKCLASIENFQRTKRVDFEKEYKYE